MWLTNNVTYSCDYGYQLSGNTTRYCLKNGPWSGHASSCLGKYGGAHTTYSCDYGYQLWEIIIIIAVKWILRWFPGTIIFSKWLINIFNGPSKS